MSLTYKQEKYEKLKKELQAARKRRSIEWFKPYDWQLEFIEATNKCKQLALFAANRVGKTEVSCALLSYHLTGNYPDWFNGYKFDGPIVALASGITGDQIRDVLQDKLIGKVDLRNGEILGGGLIPTESIGPYINSQGTKNLMKEVHIRHKSGEYSKLMFRSYEQGPAIIRGQSLDWILIDEEPNFKAMEFYAECLARTATGDKKRGGFTAITFTPENGVTELVDMLLNKPQPGQHVMTVGWDRAPHLDEATKDQLLKAIPRYMLSAKTKGIPNFGETQVFHIAEEEVICKPFKIPNHFRVLCGIDFGINHPFAAVFAAHDVDRDIIYIYDTIRVKDQVPAQHVYNINSKMKGIRIVFPHDANNRERGSGETLRKYYEDAGANMFRQFHNPDDTIHVEPGIMEMETRFHDGRLKVFSHLETWLDEFRKFHRNPKNGKIVKEHDDLMDATRYVTIMIPRFGEYKSEVGEYREIQLYPALDY